MLGDNFENYLLVGFTHQSEYARHIQDQLGFD